MSTAHTRTLSRMADRFVDLLITGMCHRTPPDVPRTLLLHEMVVVNSLADLEDSAVVPLAMRLAAHLLCPATDFNSLLTDVVRSILGATARTAIADPISYYSVVHALRIADRLVGRIHKPSGPFVELGRASVEFARAESARRFAKEMVTGRLREITGLLVDTLRKRAAGFPSAASTVRFVGLAPCATVQWLDVGGRVVATETLADFARPLAEACARMAAKIPPDQVQKAEDLVPPLFQAIRDIDVGLAEGIRAALKEREPTRFHLFSGDFRQGLPAAVFLVVSRSDSPELPRNCVVAVERRHGEFILENESGDRYWFPPCLLAAQIAVAGHGCRFLPFLVVEPAGGYVWNHPYTGAMVRRNERVTPLSGLEAEKAVLGEASAAAARHLHLTRVNTPSFSDMCLEGQATALAQLSCSLVQTLAQENGDVVAVIDAVHRLAHIGLTRAHQGNRGLPRAHMGKGNMPYPLPKGMDATIGAPVYPYNPANCGP